MPLALAGHLVLTVVLVLFLFFVLRNIFLNTTVSLSTHALPLRGLLVLSVPVAPCLLPPLLLLLLLLLALVRRRRVGGQQRRRRQLQLRPLRQWHLLLWSCNLRRKRRRR